MGYVMSVDEFMKKLLLAVQVDTHYIKGCFGAPMNAKNRIRYSKNNEYNKVHAEEIKNLPETVFGFDCVCLIKGILWGWNADYNLQYGGAKYTSNGVPDFGSDSILKYCHHVTDDFTYIIPGSIVWMPGHCGIYIGDGKAIECTPRWSNDVQLSNVANVGNKSGNSRRWWKCGRLNFIDYGNVASNKEEENIIIHTVVKGDCLTKIAKKYGVKNWTDIAEMNGLDYPYLIKVGQKLKVKICK